MTDQERAMTVMSQTRARMEAAVAARDRAEIEASLEYTALAAQAMFQSGRIDDASELAELVIELSVAATGPRSQSARFKALGLQAQTSLATGRLEDGAEILARAAAEAWESDQLRKSGAAVEYMIGRAQILREMGRDDDVVTLLREALFASQSATNTTSATHDRQVTLISRRLAHALIDLGRYAEVQEIGSELPARLRSAGRRWHSHSEALTEGRERALAGALSDLQRAASAWPQLTRALGESQSRQLAAEAVRLYSVTQPWAVASVKDVANPAAKAAAIVRGFADRYALLSALSSVEQAERLPLPNWRDVTHALLESPDIVNWAAGLGHVVSLREPDSEVPSLDDAAFIPAFMPAVIPDEFLMSSTMKLFWDFDVLVLRHGLDTDSAVWEDEDVRVHAVSNIERMRLVIGELARNGEPPASLDLAIVGLLVAQTLFVASHRTPLDQVQVPSPADLCVLLSQSGATNWLLDRGGCLPSWAETGLSSYDHPPR